MFNLTLSVIISCFNEEENISGVYKQTLRVLYDNFLDYEMIFIDDGSRDDTLAELRKLALINKKVKVISLARNFGHEAAIACGIDHASGDYIAIMDADLQDPPELLADMTRKCVEEGYDVVYGVRRRRSGETVFKKATSFLFYKIQSKLSDVDIPRNTGDFRVFSARVGKDIKMIREKNRYMRGLISWVGYRQTGIFFDRPGRSKGKTKYNFLKLLNLAFTGMTSFSTRPLRMALLLGSASMSFSVVIFIYIVYSKLAGIAVSGWTSLTLLLLFFSSVQFLLLWILGEYIGQIFYEAKDRPLYLIKEELNMGDRRVYRPAFHTRAKHRSRALKGV